MKKKIISIITIVIMLVTAVLVSPVISSKNIKLLDEEKPTITTLNNNVDNAYNIVMKGIYEGVSDKEEWKEALKFLYTEVSRGTLQQFYGSEYVYSLDYFLNPGGPIDNDAITQKHYRTIMNVRNQEQLSASKLKQMKTDFEESETWNCNSVEEFLSKLDDEKRNQVEKMFYGETDDSKTVADYIVNQKNQPYDLLTQIKNNLGITKDTVIFILQILFAIACGVIVVIPGGIMGICAIEGAAVALGACGALGDVLANVGTALCELIPQDINPFNEDGWEAICSFMLGGIVFAVTFFILYGATLTTGMGVGIFFIAMMEAAKMIGNEIWKLDKSATSHTARMPLLRTLLLRFFPQKSTLLARLLAN